MARFVLACAVVLVICPAGARAATVQGAGPSQGASGGTLRFTAAPGEANQVTMRQEAVGSDFYDVSDLGAALTATGTCVTTGAHDARCDLKAPGAAEVFADLGDRDDSFSIDGAGFLAGSQVSGGPGNDTITGACTAVGNEGNDDITLCDQSQFGSGSYADGGLGDDTITGGAANDDLQGGGGHDSLHGGPGNDFLNDDDGLNGLPVDADVLDGGPGEDELFYGAHPNGVRVNLATQGLGGAPGEGDTISGIEDVTGGNGPDVLIGDDGPNKISGRAGADKISGGGGDDLLQGGAGSDRIDGGDGNDTIYARDLFRDHISCGTGMNGEYVEPGDVLAADCGHPVRQRVRLIREKRLGMRVTGKVFVDLSCTELGDGIEESFGPCPGTLTIDLRRGRRWVRAGSARCSSAARCVGGFGVRLNDGARRRVAQVRRVTARVTFLPLGPGALPERHVVPLHRSRFK